MKFFQHLKTLATILEKLFSNGDMQLSYAEIFDLAIKLKAYEDSFEATSQMQMTNVHLKKIIQAIYES